MKIKHLLLFLGMVASNLGFGQVNVVLIFNNDGAVVNEIINELTSSKQFKNVNIRHMNINRELSSREELTINEKTIEKVNIKKGCDFDYCEKLKNTIENDFSSVIYFYSKRMIACIQNNEKIEESSVNFSFKNEFVTEKINEQVLNFKKTKKSVSLYFNYITDEYNELKPSVSFKSDTLILKAGDNVNLTPNFSSNPKEVIWQPTEGLSCINCESPTLKAKNNIQYLVKYIDQAGCPSGEAKINIVVKSICDSLKKLEIKLSKFKKVYGQDFEYEILPISSEGGFRYDIPVTRNCASKFKLSVKNIYGKVVYEIEKDREEILNNADKLFGEDSDLFLFRINLKDYYKEVKEGAVIFIESYDENGIKFKSYVSPQVSFSGCNK